MPLDEEQECVEVYELTVQGGWLKICRAFVSPIEALKWVQPLLEKGPKLSLNIYSMPVIEWKRVVSKLSDGNPGVPVYSTAE